MTNPTAAPDIGLTTETDAAQPGWPSSLREDWPTSAHGDAGGELADTSPKADRSDPLAGSIGPSNYCSEHSGEAKETDRQPYDHIMVQLARNQSGEGRHACPYCAYRRGREDVRRELQAWLGDLIPDDPA